MRHAAMVFVIGAAFLAITSAAVTLGGDSTVLVPPPESVGEHFARLVASRRYDRALQQVDDMSGITLTTVRLGGDSFLEQNGAVDNVVGEPGPIRGNEAVASALLITERSGRVRFNYRLTRRRGLWKIAEWEVR